MMKSPEIIKIATSLQLLNKYCQSLQIFSFLINILQNYQTTLLCSKERTSNSTLRFIRNRLIICQPYLYNYFMKQSEIQHDNNERPEITKHNRFRLIQQNKRLLIEIQKLELLINSALEKTVASEFQYIEEAEELKNKYKKEQNQQLREIARLKKQIKITKASLAEHKYDEVKKEENQIAFLRKQYDKLASEKYTLTHRKRQKEQALEYYKPLNSQTSETYENYKKIKSQNGQLKSRVHSIERQVNKYHKIKEMAKTVAPKNRDNPDFQFAKIDNEIISMEKQMKRIQQKWKAKVQSLDKEYFGFKSILSDKETTIDQLEREVKTLEHRMTAFRDETAIASDRQRISSLPISPKKRKQMENLMEEFKNKSKKLQRKNIGEKIPKENPKKENFSGQASSAQVLPTITQNKQEKEKEGQVQQPSVMMETPKQQEKIIQASERPSKMVESIGVGTTFYYDGD